MKWFAVALFIWPAACLGADDPKLPNGVTCEDIRRTVAEVGRVRAVALAIENGATWAQIREASKCLNQPRK